MLGPDAAPVQSSKKGRCRVAPPLLAARMEDSYLTITSPFIPWWMEQRYVNVPFCENV